MDLRYIARENFFVNLAKAKRKPWQDDYLAMYSTQWKGFVTDPDLMVVPIDDHLVHRGDGVFDVMRCFHGKIYQMEAHLQRLERSAKAISLPFPPEYPHIREMIKTLVLKGGEKDCLIRVILSRGPGSFSTNPFDCPMSQLYITILRYHAVPQRYYSEGIPLITCKVPGKEPFFSTIKSCNYLQNVLMKLEAVQAGCQYSVSMYQDGALGEGSTENIGVVSRDGILKFPGFERTLAGTTLTRIFTLAGQLETEGLIRGVRFEKILQDEAYRSSEIMLIGTSINILPVITYDGHVIGAGKPGPVYLKLLTLLERDMEENRDLLTDVEWNGGI